MKWRLQASWAYGDDRRSYAPFWENSEREAEIAAVDIRDTLSHFVALEISIEQVTDEAAAAEAEALSLASKADDRPVTHLLKSDRTIACGAALEDTSSWAVREFFDLGSGNRCEQCRRTLK